MHIGIFDLFTIGIGPSSSHTVGPMRAAAAFAGALMAAGSLERVARVRVGLFGSLGLTGRGHGTDKALMLGLEGENPEEVAVETIPARLAAIRAGASLNLAGRHPVAFDADHDLVFHRRRILPEHPNGMEFHAFDEAGGELAGETWYSTGGGFIARAGELGRPAATAPVPYAFDNAAELMSHCAATGLRVCDLMLANERALRPAAEIAARLARVWQAMQDCVARGCATDGELPGGLRVRRRAGGIAARPAGPAGTSPARPAHGDRFRQHVRHRGERGKRGWRPGGHRPDQRRGRRDPGGPALRHPLPPAARRHRPREFLLTAAAIGALYKKNASISGADVGCQGEVGVACSMAAGALAEYLGGTPAQVENAAEIGMEHNLGLTCDPIGGLVQIPCIERNAMGAVKAINAARIALRGDGTHFVPLDKVIRTMFVTGRDMNGKYKETARGGLAVNVVEC
jgi:L-serine dehydratase